MQPPTRASSSHVQRGATAHGSSALRADALAASVALWCGTLDEQDLRRVEAFVLSVRAEQEHVGDWIRPQGDAFKRFCQVGRVAGGVLICHCGYVVAIHDGGWQRQLEPKPPLVSQRCERCSIEAGLAELARTAPEVVR